MRKLKHETQNIGRSRQTAVFLVSLGLMIVGTAGLFMFRGQLIGYTLAHLGAVGLTGIIAWVTGLIARKRGFRYWKTFIVALAVPLALGLAAALGVFYLANIGSSIACGGSVSLAVSILIILGYAVAKSKTKTVSLPTGE